MLALKLDATPGIASFHVGIDVQFMFRWGLRGILQYSMYYTGENNRIGFILCEESKY